MTLDGVVCLRFANRLRADPPAFELRRSDARRSEIRRSNCCRSESRTLPMEAARIREAAAARPADSKTTRKMRGTFTARPIALRSDLSKTLILVGAASE